MKLSPSLKTLPLLFALLFIASACGTGGSSPNQVLSVEESAPAQTFLEALSAGDAERASSLIAEDVILGLPDGTLLTGKQDASEYWTEWVVENSGSTIANATYLALEMREPYKGVPRGKWIMTWYDQLTVSEEGDSTRVPGHISFYLGQGDQFLYMATYQDQP